MKSLIILIVSWLFVTSLHAQTIVNDPTVVVAIGNQIQQGAQQLQQLQQQLQTAKSLYDTAQNALKYQGNPANILGGIKDAALGGSLNPSTIGSTFDRLLGSVSNLQGASGVSSISSQLQSLVGAPLSVDAIKSQLLAGQTPTNNLVKYQAMEKLFDQQTQQIQAASAQSANLRSELTSLRAQVASSPDQATTEKLNAAIDSTSAALATTDATITQLNQQIAVSTQMVQNRKMMEDANYQEAYKQVSDQQAHASATSISAGFQNINNTR